MKTAIPLILIVMSQLQVPSVQGQTSPQLTMNSNLAIGGCGGEVHVGGLNCNDSFWCGHPFQMDAGGPSALGFFGLSGSTTIDGNSISFDIDTAAKLIRNFIIQNSASQAACDYSWPGTSSEQTFITFDSMPFIGSTDSQVSVDDSSVNVDYKWSASFSYITKDYQCSGGTKCENALTCGVHFTIDFLQDDVSSLYPQYLTSFAIVTSDPKFLLARFSSKPDVRQLVVYNMLGSEVLDALASEFSTYLELPLLPPGCYFARLGDAVAKFIVPPR